MPLKMMLHRSLIAFDRISPLRVHSEGGGWHNKCRGGYQVADRAQASGSSSERTGRKKTGGAGGRKVSLLNKLYFKGSIESSAGV